jgi:hypothetical protein
MDRRTDRPATLAGNLTSTTVDRRVRPNGNGAPTPVDRRAAERRGGSV